MKLRPFKVEASPKDQPIIIVNYKGLEKKFRPEEITSMILRKMKEIAENYLGKCVNSAVITVPAYFNDIQRDVIQDAGIISGIKVLQIIDQPTAASIAYGLDIKKKINILIFDLGGSTFEVSLVVLDQGKYKVKATSRDMYLKGVDFDKNITQYCGEEILKQIGIDINANFRAERRLRMQCERAKKTLSQSDQATIEIDNLIENFDFILNITRFKFEQLCSNLFTRLIPPIEEVIQNSQISQDQIQQVLLVGGSSNIPKIEMIIKDLFPEIEIIKLGNPDEIIAQGATIMANGIFMNNKFY